MLTPGQRVDGRALLPGCAVCGRPCIPLADYDLATCIRCDEIMGTVLARAAMVSQPTRTLVAWGRPRLLQPCGTHAAFTRHVRRGEPVDELCDTAERRYRSEKHAARRQAGYADEAAAS